MKKGQYTIALTEDEVRLIAGALNNYIGVLIGTKTKRLTVIKNHLIKIADRLVNILDSAQCDGNYTIATRNGMRSTKLIRVKFKDGGVAYFANVAAMFDAYSEAELGVSLFKIRRKAFKAGDTIETKTCVITCDRVYHSNKIKKQK